MAKSFTDGSNKICVLDYIHKAEVMAAWTVCINIIVNITPINTLHPVVQVYLKQQEHKQWTNCAVT